MTKLKLTSLYNIYLFYKILLVILSIICLNSFIKGNNCSQHIHTLNETDSWNSAWVDVNNDGWEDLFVADRDPTQPNQLYINDGNGGFILDINSGLSARTEISTSGIWGDFNNDGWIDVMVLNSTESQSRLYKNVEGKFIELMGAGIDNTAQYFHSGAWLDIENDGDLDLILANYFETEFHQVYINNGDETFIRKMDTPLAREQSRATMVALSDYDNDGLVDIFIPNGAMQANHLYKNLGNGNFEKIIEGDVVTEQFNSVGAAWGDYNNDGWEDLIVVNASNQANQLYLNNNGKLEKVNNPFENDTGDNHSASWLDYDNDGDLDLLITDDVRNNIFYINDGQGNFSKAKDSILLNSNTQNTMGSALADYDRDGDIDVYLSSHSLSENVLFCNDGNENNFINIKLIGINSNILGIGAKIHILIDSIWQTKQVLPNQGLGSQNSFRQHFGLGNARVIKEIVVEWPSGFIQTLEEIKANEFITIIEENANLVTGIAFHDENNNCVRDEGEQAISDVQIFLNQGDYRFSTNDNSEYFIYLNSGSYNYAIEDTSYWKLACTTTINFECYNGEFYVDIPLTPTVKGFDLSVKYSESVWRRGFEGIAILDIQNKGTQMALQAEISITYPAGASLVSANIPWIRQEGNTYIWEIDSLNFGRSLQISLVEYVDLSVAVGDVYPIVAMISSDIGDIDLSNNTYTNDIPIIGAIDPNDMLVSPKGIGNAGFIEPNQLLTYTIRFQNIGSFKATWVTIQNQIPDNLDLTTLKVKASSHPIYATTLSPNGLLKFRFEDINLVPKIEDEVKSNGFVKYTIYPKQNILPGSQIKNSASISFDYEDPIITNTVLNTIYPTHIGEPDELMIFPNPAVDVLNIMIGKDEANDTLPILTYLELVSIDGKILSRIHNTDAVQITIDVESLSRAVYFVVGQDDDGNYYKGKFIKQ